MGYFVLLTLLLTALFGGILVKDMVAENKKLTLDQARKLVWATGISTVIFVFSLLAWIF